MSRRLSQTSIQVLYEIALSIGPEETVERTAESAVSTYLQKLNCSAAAVYETGTAPDDPALDVVTRLPEGSALADVLDHTRDTLLEGAGDGDHDETGGTAGTVRSGLPRVDEVEPGVHRYVMALPEFGVLVLLKRGPPLDDDIVQSLPDLNEKLATACTRVRFQEQYETQYRELFEEAPVMFALTRAVDGEPVIEDCNREFAERLGYPKDHLLGRPLAEFYTEESKRALLEHGYEEALEGRFGTEERVFRTREGRRVVTVLRAAPRLDGDGSVVGTRALFVDVTELTRRNQQISILNRVLRHNIRNELNVIRAKLDIATERAPADVCPLLEDIYAATENLLSTAEGARQIPGVLDKTDRLRQDLATLVESLTDRAREEYPDIDVEADLGSETVPVSATGALEDALWELFENACEHAGDSPEVTVTVRERETTATVAIADDGPGIPPAERRILGEGEETEIEHGSGLGLWLVYWVLEVSGGDVDFDCDDGTTVTVSLPLADPADAQSE